jgi:hypothetical protein
MPGGSTRRRVRLLFLAALVVMVAQIGYKKVADEPYPGIFQPTFAGTPSESSSVQVFEPLLTARYEDGATRSFDADELFHDARVLPSRIFRTAFEKHASSVDNPEVTGWLHERLTDLGGGTHVDEATIEWRTANYPTDKGVEPTYETTKTRVVDFGEQE